MIVEHVNISSIIYEIVEWIVNIFKFNGCVTRLCIFDILSSFFFSRFKMGQPF